MGHPEIEHHAFQYAKEKGFITLNKLLRFHADLTLFMRICNGHGFDVYKSERMVNGKEMTTFEVEMKRQYGYIDGVEAMPCMVKITDLTNRKGEPGCGHYKECYNHSLLGRCRVGRIMEEIERELENNRMERISSM